MICHVHTQPCPTDPLQLPFRLEELHVPTSSVPSPGLADEEKQKYEDMAKESNDEYLKKMEDSTVSDGCFFHALHVAELVVEGDFFRQRRRGV